MCTVVILRRPAHDWPLILGANRDEMRERAWQKPARHWPDRPEVVAGRDEAAGGSWLGLNDHGVVAAILNRPGTLGRAPFTRSRGELVLEALDHADAADAVAALAELDPTAYRANAPSGRASVPRRLPIPSRAISPHGRRCSPTRRRWAAIRRRRCAS